MAIYHCTVKAIGRGKGKSAVAAAAYRAGEKLHDAETGLTHDYTHKGGVVHSEVILCQNAPAEYADRQTLWNAVHKVEKQADARLAREFEVALPNELGLDQAKALAHQYGQSLADEGMCVDYSIHWKDGNHHIHYMATTRPIKENGEWGTKERKAYALDEHGQKIPLLDENGNQKVRVRAGKGEEKLWKRELVDTTGWNKREKVEEWRARWADHANQYLLPEQQISHLSYEQRGITQIPTVHEGYAAREMEADGRVSERCEMNREIRAANKELAALSHEQTALRAKLTELLAQIRDMAREALAQKRPVSSQQEQAKPTITPVRPTPAAPEQPKTGPEQAQSPENASQGVFGRIREGMSTLAAKRAEKAVQRAAEAEKKRQAEEQARKAAAEQAAAQKVAEEAARQRAQAAYREVKERLEDREAAVRQFLADGNRDYYAEKVLKDIEERRNSPLGANQLYVLHFDRAWRIEQFSATQYAEAAAFADQTERHFVQMEERRARLQGKSPMELFKERKEALRPQIEARLKEQEEREPHKRTQGHER